MDLEFENRKARFMQKFKILPESGCWEWQTGKIYKKW